VKGAYTGAHEDKKGLVEAANGGILFLDEFNSLPYDIQVNLLRVIEYNTFTKVGGTVEQTVDIRIIAAGNESFEKLVKTGELRPDLRERFIKVIYVPTLNERIEDFDYFIDRFLSEENKRQDKTVCISSEARNFLINQRWQGNIRQLKNVIATLVIEVEMDKQSKKDVIQLQLVKKCFDEYVKCFDDVQENSTSDIQEVDIPKEDYTLQTAYDSVEKKAIIRALEKAKGNNGKAINLLGISRATYYKLKEKFRIVRFLDEKVCFLDEEV
jgi:transcriptional regulator with PAS, ATPase and Fis domain